MINNSSLQDQAVWKAQKTMLYVLQGHMLCSRNNRSFAADVTNL